MLGHPTSYNIDLRFGPQRVEKIVPRCDSQPEDNIVLRLGSQSVD